MDMDLVVMKSEDLERLLDKVVSKAIETYAVQVPSSLPPILNRAQFMKLLGISAPKATEVMRRADFPVNREFGNPRIPTSMLLRWIEEHTNMIQ